jgi:hypothetical protein
MSYDLDKMILAWLDKQPAGAALAKEIPIGSEEDYQSLESRGLILRVPSKEPGGDHGYVINEQGRAFQAGD